MSLQTITLTVNGQQHRLETYPLRRLLDILREDLGLTGTKEGCGEGECGACSVLLNDELVNSCLVPAMQVDGARISTIEGVGHEGELHELQKAFAECGAAQCGICTPGMVMASIHLLAATPHPSMEQIREGLSGNLCRCTGYQKIFEAVYKTAQREA